MKPIDWRKAVRDAELEPMTKLVLHTISVHINPEQDYVFPSVRYIAEGASIAASTAQVHIDKAVLAGFLIKENTKRKKGGKGANRYYPEIPDHVVQNKLKNMKTTDDRQAVIDDDRQAVQGVPAGGDLSNMSTEQEEKDTNVSKKAVDESILKMFDQFWQTYPKQRRVDRTKSLQQFIKAVEKEGTTARIMRGVRAYAKSDEVARGFAKQPAGWLKEERWNVEYRPSTTRAAAAAKREHADYAANAPSHIGMSESRIKAIKSEVAMGTTDPRDFPELFPEYADDEGEEE